jgi:glutathione S-transferase
MKLIGSLTSPYVRKARIAFLEKKIDVELIIDPVWSADSQLPGVNPLGKVPALIMEDGGAMFDSRVIVEYADTLSPVGRLIPSTGKEKAAVKTWEALADGVLDAAILVRLEKTWGPRDGQVCQAWVDRQMQKVAAGLQAMSDGLRLRLDKESTALFGTARLWDDGIIDPADTRRVLALGLSASLNAPIPETKFGLFRM